MWPISHPQPLSCQMCPESERQLWSSFFTSNAVHRAMGPPPALRLQWSFTLALGIIWVESDFANWGFHLLGAELMWQAALGSLLHCTFPLTSSVVKPVKDQGRRDGKLTFVLALNVLLLQKGMGPHLLPEVILGLHGAPNPISGHRDCCFWKAILVAECPVKMQSSSQTKDLIKDHFAFTAFFTTTAVYGTLNSFTAPLPLPWVYWP